MYLRKYEDEWSGVPFRRKCTRFRLFSMNFSSSVSLTLLEPYLSGSMLPATASRPANVTGLIPIAHLYNNARSVAADLP